MKGIDVYSCNDLQDITKNLSSTYILKNNIDCSNIDFKTMGDIKNPFSGIIGIIPKKK